MLKKIKNKEKIKKKEYVNPFKKASMLENCKLFCCGSNQNG